MNTDMASLTDDDLRRIAEYYAARAPTRTTVPISEEMAARGSVTAEKLGCAECHQRDYSGRDEVPRLAGLNPRYLQWQMFLFSAGKRPHPAISPSHPLAETAAVEIANYLARLPNS
jgi:cytochrome c553